MYRLTKWLIIGLVLITSCSAELFGQQLTLEEANRLARENYPAIRQKDLVRLTSRLNIQNLSSNFLPQLALNGQATYQSDVTAVEVPIPGIKIEAPEKDQYKITAEVSQLVYDGGATKAQKTWQTLNAAVEDQQLEVELYKVRERINQVFLSVLFIDAQMRQVELTKSDIEAGLKRVEAQLQHGTAFRSNADMLRAELIKTEQRRIELASTKRSLLHTLSLFLGKPIDTTVILQTPVATAAIDTNIRRPEISLFNNQLNALGQQNKFIQARNLPRTSLFFQGGYGRPGLNMLKNEFDLFYITGIRFNWSFGGMYTHRNERRVVQLNQDVVNARRDIFLLNTRTDIVRQQGEITKLQQLIEADKQIIDLRKSVTAASRAQLENAVITSADYLREVNAEDQARQTMITHELQLLQSQIQLGLLTGN